jgi:pimeloyl-ACP methyl ester carboxylesterase
VSGSEIPDPLPTSDPEPETLLLPEGALAFVDEGPRNAPAWIALHGIPGSIRDFRYLAPQLTETIRLVRVDLPGFGRSAAIPDAIASFGGRFRVLLRLADHLGLTTFGLLGHSMGGGTALAMASQNPERVSALVLLASVALSRHRGLGLSPRTFGRLARGLALPVLGRILAKAVRERYRRLGFPGADAWDTRTLATHFRAISATRFSELRRAVSGRLPPTFVAYAEDDHMVEKEISEALAHAIPGARVLAFEEGGHNLQKTRALDLGRAIREWVSELEARDAL